MAFLDDFRKAIEDYDGDSMDVKLVAFQSLGPGGLLNPGEWFRYQIQVYNQGHLNLKRVSVRVSATEFAQVGLTWGIPSQGVTVPFGDMLALSSKQSGWVYGLALKATDGPKNIVTARVLEWDADLTHLLVDHSGFGPPEGVISQEVFPG
jgi:hypothetical protein